MYDQGEFDRYNILQGDEYGVQIFCSNNSHITVYLDEKLRAKKKFRKVIEKVTYVDLVTLRGRAKREDRKKKSMGVLRL